MAADLALYIPSIEISGFKSLKHLKIDSFGSINLLTIMSVNRLCWKHCLSMLRRGIAMSCFGLRAKG